jgi:XTP/dITP diphosphohydrolase
LGELEGIPASDRTARFVSVVALTDSAAKLVRVERGVCEGRIIDSARGSNGFGYDPIFVPHGFTLTFAELPAETKDAISHRGKALQAMQHFLMQQITLNLTHGDLNS